MKVLPAYKYQLLLLIVSCLCFYFFYQSLQKDHSMEMTVQKNKLLDDARKREENYRAQWQDVVIEKNRQIQYGLIRDSFAQVNTNILYEQLNKIPNRYNEKVKVINNLGSDELREYFRSLPRQPDNDY